MNIDLSGRTAVVTGGTSGIGAAIVAKLAGAGATVFFTGRDTQRGDAVAKATSSTFYQADAADVDEIQWVVNSAHSVTGRLDVLVNNAASPGPRGGVEEADPAAFDSGMALLLRGPLLFISASVRLMRLSGGGSIINIASAAAHRPGAYSLVYSIAKAGLIHLTRCAATELGKYGIRVNSVSPGYIDTPMHARAFGLDSKAGTNALSDLADGFVKRQPISRLGVASDVANAVLYLAGDEAGFITGTDIVADGGLIWGGGK